MTVVAYSGGGGIYSNDGGSLTIVNSIISGNRAAGGQNPSGGGVAGGSLTIINSTINSNSAVGGFPFTFGDGGGISGGGTITNSTITGNYAGLSGGGIAGGGTISNCTISNNGAGGGTNNFPGTGGGIWGGGTITNCYDQWQLGVRKRLQRAWLGRWYLCRWNSEYQQ